MLTRWIEKQQLQVTNRRDFLDAKDGVSVSTWQAIGKIQMTLIKTQDQQQDRQQAQRLKRNIKRLIKSELQSINPWWLISFHYRDHHSKEDALLEDVADLKRKIHRIIYKSRDKTIKGAGAYIPTPRFCFFTKPATRAQVSIPPT